MAFTITRRTFITAFGGAAVAAPLAASSQPSSKVYRLGSLNPALPLAEGSPLGKVLIDALAQRGYVIGQNLTYDARGAIGDNAKLPELMQALKAENVDVIVGIGYPAAVVAKASKIPTVIAWGVGDPVATGLIDGLARPGGNVTGISDVATMLTTKRLSLLKEFSPAMRRVAMLWNKDDLAMTLRYQASAAAAQSIGVIVQPLGVREPNDFDEAFAAMKREPPDAILMVADALTVLNRKCVFDFAAERRLPAIYEYSFLVRDGGLMSYGPDLKESVERVAVMVDRIFKGARPADLPFEEPTHYPFALNLKTAKAAGFTVPVNLLALADEVIE
jgi:putative tryptophan/tyrosine transport system substrate-binding protein